MYVADLAVRVVVLAVLAVPSVAQQPVLVELQGDEPGDRFGAALSVTGDVDGDGVNDYIVGAPTADAGGDRRGKAWVFSGADHSVLHVFAGTLDAHQLGFAVSGAGDVNDDGREDLVVGEPWPVSGATMPGRALVFSGADGQTLLVLEGLWPGDQFGSGVAGVDDVNGDGHADIAVGAPRHGCGPQCPGRIAIFSGVDGQELLGVVGWESPMALGRSLSAYRDTGADGALDLLVGAPSWDGSAFWPLGGAFVLSTTTGLVQLSVPGTYVGIKETSNQGLNVGALGDLDGDGLPDLFLAGSESGSTGLLSVRTGAHGSEMHHLHLETDQPDAAPLGDVDGDGLDDFVVGEDGAAGLMPPESGMVSVRSGADASTLMIQRGDAADAHLGATVATLGDADSDGRPEILAGAPGPPTPGSEPGRVVLFEHAPLVAPWLTVAGDGLTATGFGSVVRAAGDVDNDGAPDAICGEPQDSAAGTWAGRARVVSGRDGRVLHDLFGGPASDQLGWSVDGAGDVDRDGFADVVVGLPFKPPTQTGAVRVCSGRTGGVLLEISGQSPFERFGSSVAGVGDVDGDAVPDILVGAPYANVAGTSSGAAYVMSGATGGLLQSFTGWTTFLSFGHSVGGGGDVDADGVPDLLVGVPNEVVGFPPTFPGTVHVFSGATGDRLHVLGGEPQGNHFGWSLDDAGDVDGDGHDDIVIGDATFFGGAVPAGRAYVFSGATFECLWVHGSESGPGHVGQGVAGLGDVDGDGRSDVLVGAPTAMTAGLQAGEVRVLSGADGSLIQAYVSFDSSTGLGTAVDRLGDLDLDGRSEVLGAAAKAAGAPDGQFSIWLSGDGSSPWSNLGAVLPGSHGAPSLLPSGTLVAGQPVQFALSGALESAPAALVVGLTALNAPFKGGTLVPAVDLLLANLATSPAGTLVLAGTWPKGLSPGQLVYAQFWVVDAAALNGFAASNAVVGVMP